MSNAPPPLPPVTPDPPHLVPPEVVDHHHAGQVQHHAQTLEGGHSEPQSPVLQHQTGRVVPAVGTTLAARQALVGHVRGLVSVKAQLLTWGHGSTWWGWWSDMKPMVRCQKSNWRLCILSQVRTQKWFTVVFSRIIAEINLCLTVTRWLFNNCSVNQIEGVKIIKPINPTALSDNYENTDFN